MDKTFEKGQIVLAKLKGYPWWPAIISGIEEAYLDDDEYFRPQIIRVDFIGENSHSNLSESHVCDYQTNKHLISKSKKQSIQAAEDILSGKFSIDQLSQINSDIQQAVFALKPDKKEKRSSYIEEIKETEDILDRKTIKKNMCLKLIEMPYTLVIFIQHKVAKLQKILSGYTAVNSYKHNIDKLTVHKMFEHFSYLLNVEPNLSIVDSCDVLKSLKYFKDKFIDSEDRILSELAKLAHKVYLFWKRKIIAERLGIPVLVKEATYTPITIKKRVEIPSQLVKKAVTPIEIPSKNPKDVPVFYYQVSTSSSSPETASDYHLSNKFSSIELSSYSKDIADPIMKKIACDRIIEVLTENGFDYQQAENLANNIEKNLRKKDPSMKAQYVRFFNLMLDDIRLLHRENYEKSTIKSISSH